jgi:hypothetical protein
MQNVIIVSAIIILVLFIGCIGMFIYGKKTIARFNQRFDNASMISANFSLTDVK